MSDDVEIAYNKQDLRKITSALKAMGDEATDAAKRESSAIAEFAQGKIQQKAITRGKAADRIASGSRVSKSSKIGELSFGFVSQKFSGGGTTKDLWGGTEFGSNKYKQFPIWSGQSPKGAGSQGWFIYPTLREIQPDIIAKWENAFDRILKEW
jgi:hypothetical protein